MMENKPLSMTEKQINVECRRWLYFLDSHYDIRPTVIWVEDKVYKRLLSAIPPYRPTLDELRKRKFMPPILTICGIKVFPR